MQWCHTFLSCITINLSAEWQPHCHNPSPPLRCTVGDVFFSSPIPPLCVCSGSSLIPYTIRPVWCPLVPWVQIHAADFCYIFLFFPLSPPALCIALDGYMTEHLATPTASFQFSLQWILYKKCTQIKNPHHTISPFFFYSTRGLKKKWILKGGFWEAYIKPHTWVPQWELGVFIYVFI